MANISKGKKASSRFKVHTGDLYKVELSITEVFAEKYYFHISSDDINHDEGLTLDNSRNKHEVYYFKDRVAAKNYVEILAEDYEGDIDENEDGTIEFNGNDCVTKTHLSSNLLAFLCSGRTLTIEGIVTVGETLP